MKTLLNNYAYSFRHFLFNGRFDRAGVDSTDRAYALVITVLALAAMPCLIMAALLGLGVLS